MYMYVYESENNATEFDFTHFSILQCAVLKLTIVTVGKLMTCAVNGWKACLQLRVCIDNLQREAVSQFITKKKTYALFIM